MMEQIEYMMEGKWKSITKFTDFKATLDTLCDDETKIQK